MITMRVNGEEHRFDGDSSMPLLPPAEGVKAVALSRSKSTRPELQRPPGRGVHRSAPVATPRSAALGPGTTPPLTSAGRPAGSCTMKVAPRRVRGSRRGSCRRAARRGASRSRGRARAPRRRASSTDRPGGNARTRAAGTPARCPGRCRRRAICNVRVRARRRRPRRGRRAGVNLIGVVQQVPEHLLQAARVGRDLRHARRRSRPRAGRPSRRPSGCSAWSALVDVGCTSTGATSSRTVPDMSLFISSRSSISFACICGVPLDDRDRRGRVR